MSSATGGDERLVHNSPMTQILTRGYALQAMLHGSVDRPHRKPLKNKSHPRAIAVAKASPLNHQYKEHLPLWIVVICFTAALETIRVSSSSPPLSTI